ncbi:BON domain-containing protein [bacterium]|nr:BON domain-containing protein [Rubripirellula sp.]MDA7874858.1 BON domain-containing protein [Rhodopirellula sp.]MDB4500431.1 BON domain-containing protein [bacterium]MDB4621292.1 BON domain-containing protein [Rubripirellula sp.]
MNLLRQAKIATAASKLLSSSSVRELRQLRIDGETNQLRLTGRVRSYYHKQLAQETIRSVAIGMRMVNQVQVET